VTISVGLLTFRRTELVCDVIRRISESSSTIDLIVINNNEDFDVLSEISELVNNKPNIRLIYHWERKNLGVPGGRKKIIDLCQTRHVILLDDDVDFETLDLIGQAVAKGFEGDERIKAIAFNIREFVSRKHNRYEIPHKNKEIDMDKEFLTYLVIGAGCALDVEAVRKVGNFSTDLGLYGFEEVDVAFRLINSGGHILYKPDCEIFHKKSPDGRLPSLSVASLMFKNRMTIARKHLKLRYCWSCFIVRSVFFLYQTRSIRGYFKLLSSLRGAPEREKFGDFFYEYIRSVRGFLWW
jgi:GT2 family glycosyltransferase